MQKIKLLLVFTLLLFSTVSFSQIKNDTVHVVSWTDEMTGESYLSATHQIVLNDLRDDSKGFTIKMIFANKLTLMTKMYGIGGCNEKDILNILLENGEKIAMESWKKFNCDGEGYFTLDDDMVNKLRSSPLSKVRITNGRSSEILQANVDNQKKYFIQLFNSYYSGNYLKK